MFNKVFVPLLALAGLLFGLHMVAQGSRPIIPAEPVAPPAATPYRMAITGSGIVEAGSENIAIATPLSGVVLEMYVKQRDRVKAGDPLFRLDDRSLLAELAVREAMIATAEGRLAELKARPRPEDIPPAEAAVAQARASQSDAESQLKSAQSLADTRALSAEEVTRRRYAVDVAKARSAAAEADLARVKAGTFAPEIAIAEAQVAEARANAKATQTEIERLTVRAPIDGEILQRNLRVGEFAQAGAGSVPLLIMGNTDRLAVRVDIDENDAWRFEETARATAFLRGNKEFSVALRFDRVEPFVVPKKSLTGETTERVDTRVMQVLYSFPSGSMPVRVGQMMDVYIEEPARGTKSVAAIDEVKE